MECIWYSNELAVSMGESHALDRADEGHIALRREEAMKVSFRQYVSACSQAKAGTCSPHDPGRNEQRRLGSAPTWRRLSSEHVQVKASRSLGWSSTRGCPACRVVQHRRAEGRNNRDPELWPLLHATERPGLRDQKPPAAGPSTRPTLLERYPHHP